MAEQKFLYEKYLQENPLSTVASRSFEDKEKREEEEKEKSSKKDLEAIKVATKGLDDEAMMESSTLKEGIWGMGTVTQIENFLRDLNRLKDK